MVAEDSEDVVVVVEDSVVQWVDVAVAVMGETVEVMEETVEVTEVAAAVTMVDVEVVVVSAEVIVEEIVEGSEVETVEDSEVVIVEGSAVAIEEVSVAGAEGAETLTWSKGKTIGRAINAETATSPSDGSVTNAKHHDQMVEDLPAVAIVVAEVHQVETDIVHIKLPKHVSSAIPNFIYPLNM